MVRARFRQQVFQRDHYSCKTCGKKADREQPEETLDAHHIRDRTLMPNGGYVKENGISLCHQCHEKAESWWNGEGYITGADGFSPDTLFELIGSNIDAATQASKRLS